MQTIKRLVPIGDFEFQYIRLCDLWELLENQTEINRFDHVLPIIYQNGVVIDDTHNARQYLFLVPEPNNSLVKLEFELLLQKLKRNPIGEILHMEGKSYEYP